MAWTILYVVQPQSSFQGNHMEEKIFTQKFEMIFDRGENECKQSHS